MKLTSKRSRALRLQWVLSGLLALFSAIVNRATADDVVVPGPPMIVPTDLAWQGPIRSFLTQRARSTGGATRRFGFHFPPVPLGTVPPLVPTKPIHFDQQANLAAYLDRVYRYGPILIPTTQKVSETYYTALEECIGKVGCRGKWCTPTVTPSMICHLSSGPRLTLDQGNAFLLKELQRWERLHPSGHLYYPSTLVFTTDDRAVTAATLRFEIANSDQGSGRMMIRSLPDSLPGEADSNRVGGVFLSLSFEYRVARIIRPWFNDSLFRNPHWRGRLFLSENGSLASGQGDGSGLLDLLPIEVLVADDLRYCIEWKDVGDDLLSKVVSHFEQWSVVAGVAPERSNGRIMGDYGSASMIVGMWLQVMPRTPVGN